MFERVLNLLFLVLPKVDTTSFVFFIKIRRNCLFFTFVGNLNFFLVSGIFSIFFNSLHFEFCFLALQRFIQPLISNHVTLGIGKIDIRP